VMTALHSCHCFVYITFMSDRFLCIADICCGSFVRYLCDIIVVKNNLMSYIKIGGFLIFFGGVRTSKYF
jgi:hypothetical protein